MHKQITHTAETHEVSEMNINNPIICCNNKYLICNTLRFITSWPLKFFVGCSLWFESYQKQWSYLKILSFALLRLKTTNMCVCMCTIFYLDDVVQRLILYFTFSLNSHCVGYYEIAPQIGGKLEMHWMKLMRHKVLYLK